jgi:lysophospholipase
MPVATLPAESPFDRRRYPEGLALLAWIAADGWRHRAYRWAPAGPPRGSLLFQSGRADFIEKYLEACAHWHRGGWTVEGFDWRGQGGSRSSAPSVVPPADDRLSFDPLIDDLAAFVADWQARTPGPHVIVAHSMGAHVALRACAERGLAPDALVLVAPMLALNTRRLPMWLARLAIAGAVRGGRGPRAAWTDDIDDPRRQLRLTASRERYEDSQWWKRERPDLGVGAPSWNWLAAAMVGARRIAQRGAVEAVHLPVLLLEAGLDELVAAQAIESVARRLPDAELVRLPDARHEILREADGQRLAGLAAIDSFLARKAPPR